jgi:hypothetical protein
MKLKQANKDELEEMRMHLQTATKDLDMLIEHFDNPCYNPAQVRVMRRVKGHINSAAEQLDEIAGARKP